MERMERVQSSIVTTTIITIGTDLKGIFHLENGHGLTSMDLHMREQATKKAQRRATRTMSVFRHYSLLSFLELLQKYNFIGERRTFCQILYV